MHDAEGTFLSFVICSLSKFSIVRKLYIVIVTKQKFLFKDQLELCWECGNCVVQGENKCPNKDKLLEICALIQDSNAIIRRIALIMELIQNFPMLGFDVSYVIYKKLTVIIAFALVIAGKEVFGK
jgi:hypothetical protein